MSSPFPSQSTISSNTSTSSLPFWSVRQRDVNTVPIYDSYYPNGLSVKHVSSFGPLQIEVGHLISLNRVACPRPFGPGHVTGKDVKLPHILNLCESSIAVRLRSPRWPDAAELQKQHQNPSRHASGGRVRPHDVPTSLVPLTWRRSDLHSSHSRICTVHDTIWWVPLKWNGWICGEEWIVRGVGNRISDGLLWNFVGRRQGGISISIHLFRGRCFLELGPDGSPLAVVLLVREGEEGDADPFDRGGGQQQRRRRMARCRLPKAEVRSAEVRRHNLRKQLPEGRSSRWSGSSFLLSFPSYLD